MPGINQRKLLAMLHKAAKEHGIAALAKKTGIPRTHFYRIFDPEYGNPTLLSVLTIAEALGFALVMFREESE